MTHRLGIREKPDERNFIRYNLTLMSQFDSIEKETSEDVGLLVVHSLQSIWQNLYEEKSGSGMLTCSKN